MCFCVRARYGDKEKDFMRKKRDVRILSGLPEIFFYVTYTYCTGHKHVLIVLLVIIKFVQTQAWIYIEKKQEN